MTGDRELALCGSGVCVCDLDVTCARLQRWVVVRTDAEVEVLIRVVSPSVRSCGDQERLGE